jgi:tRNA (cmo5U34)-methyltransferase
MPHANDFFDLNRATNYDRKIRLTIPGYEGLHTMSAALLGAALRPDAHLLVVGAGTGTEIVMLGARHPHWHFTAVDPSPEMTALCRAQIANAGLESRVKIVESTLDALPALPAFDAATSLLVSHFIQDNALRAAYFAGIASRLRSGAPLTTAELLGDRSLPAFEVLMAAAADHKRLHGIPEAEIQADGEKSRAAVTFLSEQAFYALLETAGFWNLTPFYRALQFFGTLCTKR